MLFSDFIWFCLIQNLDPCNPVNNCSGWYPFPSLSAMWKGKGGLTPLQYTLFFIYFLIKVKISLKEQVELALNPSRFIFFGPLRNYWWIFEVEMFWSLKLFISWNVEFVYNEDVLKEASCTSTLRKRGRGGLGVLGEHQGLVPKWTLVLGWCFGWFYETPLFLLVCSVWIDKGVHW